MTDTHGLVEYLGSDTDNGKEILSGRMLLDQSPDNLVEFVRGNVSRSFRETWKRVGGRPPGRADGVTLAGRSSPTPVGSSHPWRRYGA